MTGCTGPKYVNDGTNVYHRYWTFSFGTVSHPLPNVDPSSFKKINGWLGCDRKHVYYQDKLVEGADPATLKAYNKPLCSDSRDYYYKGEPLHVYDMKAFQILKLDDYHLWAKDSRNAYFDNTIIEGSDVATFCVLNSFEAKDNRHVYYFGKVLEGADPSTYTKMKGGYTKDCCHVWYCGKLVDGADAPTFTTIGTDGTATDKNARYDKGKRIGR